MLLTVINVMGYNAHYSTKHFMLLVALTTMALGMHRVMLLLIVSRSVWDVAILTINSD